MLGTRANDDSLVAVQLTVDLKPNLPGIYLLSGIRLLSIHLAMEPISMSSSNTCEILAHMVYDLSNEFGLCTEFLVLILCRVFKIH